MTKHSLTDYLFLVMKDGEYFTFWQLQEIINSRFNIFYGEPTISAGLRKLRNPDTRIDLGLPLWGEVVLKRKRKSGKGYEYSLIRSKD
jgi:hypothetical protein